MSRSILITGCSSGIGLAAAGALAGRGWRVFAAARREEDVERLAAAGLDALHLDYADSASIGAAMEQLLAQTGGRLDALFNNGAYGQPGAVEDLDRETLRRQFETNLFGWVELTNLALPVMRRQGHGRIVMCSSLLGYVALPLRGAYTASKYALEGITDTLRLELRGTGIEVALIEPGPIDTRFRANSWTALCANIDRERSNFRDLYAAAEERLTKEGPAVPFTLPSAAVVKKLIHALEDPRPRPRYLITLPAHLFWWLRRLLPTGLLDAVLRRAGG